MRTLDRYVARELLTPFLLALAIFTFVLAVRPMLDHAEQLLSKGVPLPTVGLLLVLLLPQALGLTLPMSLLAGLLMAFGRLSADREGVALLACGVSPLRLLRPLFVAAAIVGGLTMYVLIQAVPDSNQRYREITYRLLAEQTSGDIKPLQFYEGFPGKVLYYADQRRDGTWLDVMLADTSRPGRPAVVLAQEGRLVLDREHQKVDVVLHDAIGYLPGNDEGVYDTEHSGDRRYAISPDAVFGAPTLTRGLTEMRMGELREQIAQKVAIGQSPHNEIMQIQQKFSFPVSCFVFALLGLAFGLHTRKEGRLAGMVVGLAVISVYYVLMVSAEAWTKGQFFPAVWARWLPNIVLGAAGIFALWWRSRSAGRGLSLPIPAWAERLVDRLGQQKPASGGPAKPSHVVVVVRVPRWRGPAPRLLDAYVGSRYLRMVGIAFFGLLVLYYIGTFVDLSEKLFKGQATAGLLLQYLWYSTPQFMNFVIPIATLVAVLGTIGGLTRSSELTVMRACGVSLYRAAVPLVVLALAWSVVLFALEERVMAPASRKAQALEDTIKGRPPRTMDVANRNWLAAGSGRLYYYVAYDPKRVELFGLSIFDVSRAPYRLNGHTYAAHATSLDAAGLWRAEDGWAQRFPDNEPSTRESFQARQLSLSRPAEFLSARVDPDAMTFGELRTYISRLGAGGFSVAEQQVSLQKKLAYPLVTLVVTLLGIPFAVMTGRRGALYGMGLAVALAISYHLLSAVFQAAGTAAILPPVLAAWAANITFLAGAIYLTFTVRT